MDLIDTEDSTPKTAEYTFFSSGHGTFSRTDHMWATKQVSINLKKTEIILCIFSDCNGMKQDINHKKATGKNTNTWRLNAKCS